MENQHRHIPGYAEMSPGQVGLMAGLKGFFNKELQERLDTVGQMLALQTTEAHQRRQQAALLFAQEEQLLDQEARTRGMNEAQAAMDQADADLRRISEARRWHAMARTDFQTAAMKLLRAVAQPSTEF